jgi:hypothetical protein
MNDTSTNTSSEALKKSNKKMLAVVSLVLILIFGTNHFTTRVGYVTLGIDVNDSTIVITPVVDTLKVIPTPTAVVAIDTTKKDTVK